MKPSFSVDSNNVVTGVYSFFVDGNIEHDTYDTSIVGKTHDNGKFFHTTDQLFAIEIEWRNSELSRTDAIIDLSDLPIQERDKLVIYRESLRLYPSSEGFPVGARPTI